MFFRRPNRAVSPPPASTPAGTLWELVLDRNRAAILAFELLWGLAMPFVYYSTMLPGYLRHLEIANVWIGLVPALHNGVLALMQPVSAYAFRPGERRVTWMRRVYALGACGYLLLGLLVLGGLRAPEAALLAAVAATLAFATTTGIGDPQYLELVVASIPPRQRGRYFGLRVVALGLGGIAGGLLAEWVLRAAPAPRGFAWCFLAGGLLYMFSTLSMAFYRDTPPPPVKAADSFSGFLSGRLLPLSRRPAFRAYLVAAVLFALAVAVFPFLGLLLRDRLGESDRLFGLLGGLFMGCNLGMSCIIGAVCDRWGSIRGFVLTLLLYSAGLIGCLLLRERVLLLAAYFLAASWLPGLLVAVTNLGLQLATHDPEDPASPAETTAVMMAAMAPARILGPILAGVALDRWGYMPVVVACAACLVAALVALTACARRAGKLPGQEGGASG